MHHHYTMWRNSHKALHHDPNCVEANVRREWTLDRTKAKGMEACRGSTSDETTLSIEEIGPLIDEAVEDVVRKRLTQFADD